MSKDDFRDRLKSYSSQPDPGEWNKMAQLLDADQEDDKKGFLWWRIGAMLLLVVVAALAYNMFSQTSNDTETQMATDVQSSQQSTGIAQEDAKADPTINNTSTVLTDAEEVETKEVKNEGLPTAKKTVSKTKDNNQKSNLKTQYNKKTNTLNTNTNTTQNNSLQFAEAKTNTNTNNRTAPISKPSNKIVVEEEQREVAAAIAEEVKEEAVVVEEVVVEVAEEVKEEAIVVEEVKEKELKAEEVVAAIEEEVVIEQKIELNDEYADDAIVLSDKIKMPWYLVSEVGVKYPLVDIDENTQSGTAVPAQKFFPSYTAGFGVGKGFGKFAIETGVSASLYQFKLGKVLSYNELEQWGSQHVGQEINVDRNEKQFTINKFALVSPYLRTQYSVPLKNDFMLGVFALANFNFVIDLPNQFESELVPTADSNFFDIRPSEDSQNIWALEQNNRFLTFDADLGCTIEKKLKKRGRLALDFSYTFAKGILERGYYTALRDSENESRGGYEISGKGPKIKLRYYLNLSK